MISNKAAPLAGAVAVGLGGLLLALPSHAAADNDFSGKYRYVVTLEQNRGAPIDIDNVRVWTVTPCGPECAHVSSSADRTPGGSGGYDGDMQLVDGMWQMTVTRPDLSACIDGRRLPGTVNYSMDPATLTGTAIGTVETDCDGAPGAFQDTFALTHAGAD